MTTLSNIKLDRIILAMLEEYECIVIPNFGGIVTHYESARIDTKRNVIHPPSTSLSFNKLLNKNDGLLAQELVMKHGFSYHEALVFIEAQVDKWEVKLKNGQKLEMLDIGVFSLTKSAQLVFQQKTVNNLRTESYGLSEVRAQLVQREGISGKLKEEYVARQASPVFNQKMKKLAASGAIAAVLILSVVWTVLNVDVVGSKAESLGLFFTELFQGEEDKQEIVEVEQLKEDQNSAESKEKEVVVTVNSDYDSTKEVEGDSEMEDVLGVDNQDVESVLDSSNTEVIEESWKTDDSSLESEVQENREDERGIESGSESEMIEAEIDNTDVVEQEGQEAGRSGNYVVIAGCFKSMVNANNYILKLQALGYDAHVCGYSSTGLMRVAYGAYETRANAMMSLALIRLNDNPQAWVTTK